MERLTKYSNDLIRNKAVNILRKLDSENGLDGDELEYSRIVKKYKHIVVLDNRRCMSYAELALQRRQKEWCICEPEKRHL